MKESLKEISIAGRTLGSAKFFVLKNNTVIDDRDVPLAIENAWCF